jgi:DNA mismatch repair ATPase MutS
MSQLPQTNNEEKYDVEYIHAGMLHKDFLQLKENKQALYLFDYGGFFVAYDEDAVVITEIFKESFLDKTKTGYYITSLRSTINNNFSLKISELQKRGYEVIMVRNS